MALILNEKYVGKNANFLFYSNRALKIYPIYFINLALLLLWSYFVYKRGVLPGTITLFHQYTISNSVIAYFVFSNVIIVGLDWLFFFGLGKSGNLFFTSNFNLGPDPKVYNFALNPIAWTVGAELMFYIFAPFVVRRKLWVVLFLLLISLSLRIILAHCGYEFAPWDDMFFPSQIMFFMGGVISYHLYKFIKEKSIDKKVNISLYFVFLMIICLYYEFFEESYLKQFILYVSTLLLIPFAFILTKKSKLDRFLGDLSYPIYISQFLFIKFVSIKAFPKPFGRGLSSLVLIIIFSVIVDFIVTKPLEKYRQTRIKTNINI